MDRKDRPPKRLSRARFTDALGSLNGVLSCFLCCVLAGCTQEAPTSTPSQVAPPAPAVEAPFTSPYLNTRPDVKYVGDAVCAGCHAEIAETFACHPMGRSLAPSESAQVAEQFGDDARNPFIADGYRYEVSRTGDRVIHQQALLDAEGKPAIAAEQPVAFAVGSGQRGRSYLVRHDGYLFQSPITWYPKKGRWDLSPGYEENNFGFHRPILEDCLFCHSNRAHRVEHTKNRYSEPIFTGHAIGCERCHGPGEPHVQYHEDGGPVEQGPLTIVNPANLEPRLREAVCQQCHLSGAARVMRRGKSPYDYRPGLPLESCIATYVLRPELAQERHFVGQVEQMYASRCFEGSGGKLGCISCHDPHVLPDESERVEFYRGRCLNCHAPHGCSLAVADRIDDRGVDNCIACHMPVLQTDVRHAATSDHRIPRKRAANSAAQAKSTPTPSPQPSPQQTPIPLVEFPPRSGETGPLDGGRDLAIALLQAVVYYPQHVRPDHLVRLHDSLQQSIARHPDDVEAVEALADMYRKLGRPRAALALYEQVLAKHPEREHSLVLAANLAGRIGDANRAVALWRRAVELNPFLPQYHADLAQAYAQAGQRTESLRVAQAGVARFPLHVGLRQFIVAGHLQAGNIEQAEAEYEKLQQFPTQETAAFRRWWEGLSPHRQTDE